PGIVQSVNGKSDAAVTLTAADVGAFPVAGGVMTGGFTAGGTSTIPNLRMGSTSVGFAGGSGGILAFPNATTVPNAAPTGAVVFVEGGLLKVRQGDNTTVTLTADAVSSVNSKTGAVSLTAADVSALATSTRGAASGVASLGTDTKVPVAQLSVASAVTAADQSITADATLTTDGDLVLPVVANARYLVTANLIWTNGAGGFACSFTGPSGATMAWTDNDSGGNATLTTKSTFQTSKGSTMTGVLVTSSTAGNLSVTWAQAVSDASATVLKKGSGLAIQRVG
ncbi:hypothetical protein AB0C62_22625, partial [Streptomyces sp. NPDC048643]